MITSRNNPRVKMLSALNSVKDRAREGLALAEGIHLAQEAFASGARVRTLVLSESSLEKEDVIALVDIALAAEVEVLEVSDECYKKISTLKGFEGVAVTVDATSPELNSIPALKNGVTAVAFGVQDPGNAGAIVRVAEAAGACACVLVGGADPWSPKFLRATMGSCFRLPCVGCAQEDFIAFAEKSGMRLLAAATGDNSTPYESADYSPPVAICLGSEGGGLPREILELSEKIHIPMAGRTESLNVAVAAGILLYEARRFGQ